MATADEMGNDHLPLLGSQPAIVEQGQIDDLLPEDVDWADSCLNDPDASQIDWTSWDAFTRALSETLSSETESLASRTSDHPVGAAIELSPSRLQTRSAKILGIKADDDSFITEGADENSEGQLIFTDIPHSALILGNHLPPTLDEKLGKFSPPAAEEGVDFPGLAMEQSTRDIFKVWDLNLPAEGDEFINELGKGFAQSSLNTTLPWDTDDSGVLKGLEDAALDDIISGMSDMSLNNFYR